MSLVVLGTDRGRPILSEQDLLERYYDAMMSVISERSGDWDADRRALNNLTRTYALRAASSDDKLDTSFIQEVLA